MPDHRVAIVILNWNGQHFLEKFLPEVISTSKNFAKIIIADNASSDDSVTYLEKYKNDIDVIQLDKNYGFTGGYNRALKQINTEYYILLNSDVQVTDNWISPVIQWMDQHPDAAACQPKIRSYHDRNLLEHAGAAGGLIDHLGYPFCRGRIYNTLEEDNGQYDDVREVFWASGACMFVRAKDFHNENGFDEEFFAHMEEIDLCWRFHSSGKKIYVVPQSVIYHVGGGTLPKSNSRKTFYNFRNNMMMIHKNLPANRLWLVIFIRLVLDGIAGFKFLLEGSFKDMNAVIKAHFYFYSSLKRRNEIRKLQIQKQKNNSIPNIYTKSIVLHYYILGKKYFKQLDRHSFTK